MTETQTTTAEQVASSLRTQLLDLEAAFKSGKSAIQASEASVGEDRPEELANLTLAFRHLEDARMRLGKVIQAATGGVSIYDKQAVQADTSNQGAPADVEKKEDVAPTGDEKAVAAKEGDACTTDDDKAGTLNADLVCVATPQVGDPCTMPDGKTPGTLIEEHDGTLTCSVGSQE